MDTRYVLCSPLRLLGSKAGFSQNLPMFDLFKRRYTIPCISPSLEEQNGASYSFIASSSDE